MAALSIRDLDDDVRDRLRIRAAGNGRSMEAEVRAIITAAVAQPEQEVGFAQGLRRAFLAVGGVDLDVPPRSRELRTVELPD